MHLEVLDMKIKINIGIKKYYNRVKIGRIFIRNIKYLVGFTK